jgi:hypothetical protein
MVDVIGRDGVLHKITALSGQGPRNGIPHEFIDNSEICRNCGDSREQVEASASVDLWQGTAVTSICGCVRRRKFIARTDKEVTP